MRSLLPLLIPAICLAGAAAAHAAPSSLVHAEHLRCEGEAHPLAIELEHPGLSWWVAGDTKARGLTQTAYQIQAASSPALLRGGKADLWDSKKVQSSNSLQVPYGGKSPAVSQAAWWRVRLWDGSGKPGAYSEPASWERGLRPADWSARWISRHTPRQRSDRELFGDNPAPLLRKTFRIRGQVASARLYVSGLGYPEMRLNGQRVGDQVLATAWTDYRQRVPYSAYDVTSMLHPGENALGAMLGNGWWNPLPLRLFSRFNFRDVLPTGEPRLIAELRIRYRNGSTETVKTDESWKSADGPVIRNSVYLGEQYDARREAPGWDRPGFNDGAWSTAVLATEPIGPLHPQESPPIRATRTLKTARVTQPQPGVFIFDLGQNFAGWARLKVKGPAGTRVQMRYGELVNKDGTLNPMTSVTGQIKNSRANADAGGPLTAVQTDAYTLRGGGEEVYTPRFTFHGFRYVEVTGYPGTPMPDAIEGLRLNSDLEPVGEFSCSNPLFNQLQEACRWTFLSNVFSVQSDCPHREKLGYGGDIAATSDAFMLNFDMSRFYRKVVHDFADDQRPNGGFTETAPFVGIADAGLGEGAGPVEWGTAHPLLVWQLYQYYGDRRLMAEQYPAAQRWLELLQAKAQDGILVNGIGDHETLAPKDLAVSGTSFYYYNALLMERIAGTLGKAEDRQRYARLATEIRNAFTQRFDKGNGVYGAGTQACEAMVQYFGLMRPADAQPGQPSLVRRALEAAIDAKQGQLDTGIFGTKCMLDVLSPDKAYQLVNQKTFPGWGYLLENGATTLWEHWAFSDNTFSHNHPMFGSVSEWFIGRLGGILPAENAAGCSRFVIAPQVPGTADAAKAPLEWVRASYRSPRGDVRISWRVAHEADAFAHVHHHLDAEVTVPPNTEAEVILPTSDATRIQEGDTPAQKAKGVRWIEESANGARFQVGSGTYRFRSPLAGDASVF